MFVFHFNKFNIYIFLSFFFNLQAGRIGSGRFNQQQRTQEQGQRKREGNIDV